MTGQTTDGQTPAARRWPRLALMLSVPLILACIGAYLWLTSGHSVSTDNAYVQQNIVSISAEVGGRVTEVAVHENQRVNAGDLLFRIDAAPFSIALAQADAEIAAAEARVTTMEITASSMDADIATARQALRYAEANLGRERALMNRGFNTRARLDSAELRLSEARGGLADAQMAEVRARAQLATGRSNPGVNPALLAARARREAALLNLARTEVRAPSAGIITQSSRLQIGQMIVSGLPMVSIVGDGGSSGGSWIEANFKETDLARMRAGQRASITIDAYDDLALSGHVVSIGAGTGAEFSVLPAQNATGNWVKVTQRVPVRIAIDGTPEAGPPRAMIAGLSVHVRVHFDDE
ncbi:MAG: HlyD family secretion protein [Sphingopyxis sp.]